MSEFSGTRTAEKVTGERILADFSDVFSITNAFARASEAMAQSRSRLNDIFDQHPLFAETLDIDDLSASEQARLSLASLDLVVAERRYYRLADRPSDYSQAMLRHRERHVAVEPVTPGQQLITIMGMGHGEIDFSPKGTLESVTGRIKIERPNEGVLVLSQDGDRNRLQHVLVQALDDEGIPLVKLAVIPDAASNIFPS